MALDSSSLTWFSVVYCLVGFVYLSFGVNSRKIIQRILLKCLPIGLLFAIVIWDMWLETIHENSNSSEALSESVYKRKVLAWGLITSCLGDGFLVIRGGLALLGILFFAVSQCIYVVLFNLNRKAFVELSLTGLLSGGFVLFLSIFIFLLFTWQFSLLLKSNHEMRRRFLGLVMPLVLIYFVLISLMLWSALMQLEHKIDIVSFFAVAGGILYYLSDILIAAGAIWQLKILLYRRMLVMVTYYSAQLFITLFVLL